MMDKIPPVLIKGLGGNALSLGAMMFFLGFSFIAAGFISKPWRGFKAGLFKNISFALGIFVMAGIGYWHWGAWDAWNEYQHQLQKQHYLQALLKSNDNPVIWIERLELKLKTNPKSAKGWYLLGRLYASQDRWDKAQEAFAKAKLLKPQSIPITVNYAQSLWQLNQQAFNDEIRSLFHAVLKQKSNQPDALAMLAMDAFLRHSYASAIDYWQQLLNVVSPQSDDAIAIRKSIAKAQQLMS